eukprot:13638611-Alexandrium_andersonii.AAC.1
MVGRQIRRIGYLLHFAHDVFRAILVSQVQLPMTGSTFRSSKGSQSLDPINPSCGSCCPLDPCD